MNKKIIVPLILIILVFVVCIATCSNGNKVKLDWENVSAEKLNLDTINLDVYVENSGSMDAYMCAGSNLKDAVFDYVSDLRKVSSTCSLYYINSNIIPYKGDLQSYIKDLTPESFAKAGGNRSNTDLRQIFENMMSKQKKNTVIVFVSDCILDLPESATDFFGNCQVSIKNTFNEALSKNPNLGVEIVKLQSKFDGYWYCGKNSEKISNGKRPYYIWTIGDKHILAKLNKEVPISEVIGGIEEYCAYSGSQPIPFDIEKNTYVINRTNKINVQLLVDLNESLQMDDLAKNRSFYKTSNPEQSCVVAIEKIIEPNSKYSHVIELQIENPETMKTEAVTFSYPYLQSWVETSNDSTGLDVMNNMNKTTGIKPLIKGVAEAYKSSLEFGSVAFNLKNK